jgi:hypothetical protein
MSKMFSDAKSTIDPVRKRLYLGVYLRYFKN